jgi:hypothetical protein
MDWDEIDFTANDARGLVKDTRHSRERVFHKLHGQIVMRIKAAAEKNQLYTTFTLPVYIMEFSNYNPTRALHWLIARLEADGFKLQVDFRSRHMIISWAHEETEASVGLGKKKKKSTTTSKKVRFKVPENPVFRI